MPGAAVAPGTGFIDAARAVMSTPRAGFRFAGFWAAREVFPVGSPFPSSCGWILTRRGDGETGAFRAAFFASHCSIVRRISRACEPA